MYLDSQCVSTNYLFELLDLNTRPVGYSKLTCLCLCSLLITIIFVSQVEVRSMGNPPAVVKLALESICLLLGENAADWKAIRQVATYVFVMRFQMIGSLNLTKVYVTVGLLRSCGL